MMAIKDDAMIVAGIALAVIYLAYKAKKAAGDAAGAALDALNNAVPYVNPADANNIVNQGANSFYRWATGSQSTIGADLYDFINPTPATKPLNVKGTPGYDGWKPETDAQGNPIHTNVAAGRIFD